MSFEPSHLRYAAAVARLGTFSEAARQCGVSQPTVSSAVAALEEQLGAKLFQRTTRHLMLTEAGRELLPLIEGVLRADEQLAREAHALREPAKKVIRVAFSPLLGGGRLELYLEPFCTTWPDVEILYKECMWDDMENRLDAGTIDVACGVYLAQRKNRGRRLLYREPLQWVPPAKRVVETPTVTLRQVAESRLALTSDSCGLAPTTRGLFERDGIALDVYAGQAISYSTLEDWAAVGIGGAILPASHLRRGRGVPVVREGRALEVVYEAVWRKDAVVAEHLKHFVSYLRTAVRRIAQGLVQKARDEG